MVKETSVPLMSYDTAFDLKLLSTRGDNYSQQNICHRCDLSINILDIDNKFCEVPKEFPKIPMEPVKFRLDESVPSRQIIRYSIPKAFEEKVHDRLQIERANGFESKITSNSSCANKSE